MTDTDKRVESAKKQAVVQRNYLRARQRALTKLAQKYRQEYKTLLEREKASDEQMGKKWLDIDGTTATSQLGLRPDTTVKHDNEAHNEGADEGDNGREEGE